MPEMTGILGGLGHLEGIGQAITNTAENWDVVLFLLGSVVIVFGSILLFLCSITKIFKFQTEMQTKAREEIRLKKRLKHFHLLQIQKEMDANLENNGKSEEQCDVQISVPRPKLPPPPLPPQPQENNRQVELIEVDLSAIDVPNTFDMWDEAPTPIASSNQEMNV